MVDKSAPTGVAEEHRQAAQSAVQLREAIRLHNHRYHTLDDPEIEDFEFDQLMRELRRLERLYPDLITPDSPTQRVGAASLPGFRLVPHRTPMLSLENAFSEEDVRGFDARIRGWLEEENPLDYMAEPKVDGVAINLLYLRGELVCAATRGDGRNGEDVTANALTIVSIPHALHGVSPSVLEVRGEVYLSQRVFLELNRAAAQVGEKVFANPRNAAAGSLRQIDPAVTARRSLEACFYAVGALEDEPRPLRQSDLLARLRDWGFPTSPDVALVRGATGCLAYYRALEYRRSELGYEADGVVYKVDQRSFQERLGQRSSTPRWQIAYKFKSVEKTTVVLGIDFQVGRSGTLTPVARLSPIMVGGTTVSNASLHNMNEVMRLDLRIGDTVVLRRAGDVIPEIVSVLGEKRPADALSVRVPQRCPVCGSRVELAPTGNSARCTGGRKCPAQTVEWIKHFASRDAMKIRGLGDRVVAELVQRQLVSTPADLYALTIDLLLELPRMGQTSARALLLAIENSKSNPLDRFLYALGIPGVGKESARVLASRFTTLDELAHADIAAVRTVKGVGDSTAASVCAFFAEEDNRALLGRFAELGLK